ncbi:hypothetical protein [Novosphingobium endophyticum]|nr:hypothetical protein [Novosphingobium endophyticum]
MSVWLGKASVVAFLDRDADEPTWQVFVSTPAPRQSDAQPNGCSDRSPFTPRTSRRPSRRRATRLPPGELDDRLNDL